MYLGGVVICKIKFFFCIFFRFGIIGMFVMRGGRKTVSSTNRDFGCFFIYYLSFLIRSCGVGGCGSNGYLDLFFGL